ncbi:hypothetical protein C5Y96_26530 [Blastopirellula marina]|uniref:Uncharacterized protein n=1 Tax=Blastopirellula marina TaxID=124 RepID=A0A2S8EYT8_9BACT|nr:MULTISPECIES: DUF4175 family protein [Pirellulaceae]PQO25062.1 hypothetical protein C5Y96_26530 [Blastopirellula marina]RCS40914.1 hypothetical protein DTL36_26580 [Bremerella cremea]
MSTSKLGSLKTQLRRLRDARDRVRVGLMLTSSFFWIAGTLLLWFVLDYGLNLSPLHRGLMMLVTVPVLAYGLSQALTALRGWGASIIDTAISVEHAHGIDGDLVAAIQFEQGQAIGSTELQAAVVDYVAELKDEIDIFEGFDSRRISSRYFTVGLLLLLFAATCAFAPRHVSAFFQRLTLAHVNYPTKTLITVISVNGQEIDLSDPTKPIPVGYGSGLELTIACQGVLPKTCRLALEDEKGESTSATLKPTDEDSGEYIYSIPRLIQPIQYQVYAGDAVSPVLNIEIITLPALKVELAATPPDYAKNIQFANSSSSTHMAVLAGSDVSLKVVADRELDAPELTLLRGASQSVSTLSPIADVENTWQLDQQQASLSNIQETVTYQLNAVDKYGLSPASPIRGTIRVVPDRIPSASLQTIHHIVLATASPVIRYRASDDFGLANLSFQLKIHHGQMDPRVVEVPLKSFAVNQAPQTSLEGEFSLDLSPWSLEVGDRVEVTLVATDFRDNAAEMPGQSDPINLEIGDESTVLAAIAEADKQSEQMLSELIQQQLGLGETQ